MVVGIAVCDFWNIGSSAFAFWSVPHELKKRSSDEIVVDGEVECFQYDNSTSDPNESNNKSDEPFVQ